MTMARSIAAAVLLAAMTASGVAQTWPSKQVDMIIAFPAGSGVDVIGRAMAAAIAQQTKQNVVVLNRDGAAGTLGFATPPPRPTAIPSPSARPRRSPMRPTW
jgi:tripartite-type tricarboxylate transporter receptor subunit TctC